MATFSSRWLASDPKALALMPDGFRHATARAAAVERASRRRMHPEVLAELRRQNPDPRHAPLLEALATPGTVAVITGQQVGLFLGHLYTLHKAATAIRVAQALEQETGTRCVPVFWLQTEDHDLPEINVHTVMDPDGELRDLVLPWPDADASRVPVAHLTLPPSVTDALADLERAVGRPLPELRGAYVPGVSWADAFARAFTAVMGDLGILVFQPRVPALAGAAAPVHQVALDRHADISAVLQARSAALEDAGMEPQIKVRARAPLSFVAVSEPRGARYRLDASGSDFRVLQLGTTMSQDTLRAWLRDEPERFSTSALLRPLLQDQWFPTAGYVGGPAEMSYFAQLAPLYPLWGLEAPLAMPRARFRLVDTRTASRLERLKLTADEVCADEASVLATLATRHASASWETPEALEARVRAAATAGLPELAERAPALRRQVERSMRVMTRSAGMLARRYGRFLAQQDAENMARLRKVQGWLWPRGVPQERVHGLWQVAARMEGPQALARRIVAEAAPFSGGLQELRS